MKLINGFGEAGVVSFIIKILSVGGNPSSI
jgi:hypothetical protein